MKFWKKKPYDPFRDPDSFGNIAIDLGLLTRDQLERAIELQEKRLPIGEILVQMGILTLDQRDELILEQMTRRGVSSEKVAMQRFAFHKRAMSRANEAIEEFDRSLKALAEG